MSLFDFLKRKKTVKKEAKKPAVASVEQKKEEKPVAEKPVSSRKKTAGFSYAIIKQPHISERATYLAEQNQYTFKVLKNANKTEIKKSVEGIYGVDVLSVNIIKIPPKKRRLGKTQGFRKGFTKAVVKIREGQKIEIL